METNGITLYGNIGVINHRGYPAVQLRRIITDEELVKKLVIAAIYEEPIVIIPKFTDKIHALNKLLDKGIVYKEDERFLFNSWK